jgi:hypothetical protein
MTSLELSPEELEILSEELQSKLSEMELEVAHTDTRDFKELLKKRQEVLVRILAKLSKAAVAA